MSEEISAPAELPPNTHQARYPGAMTQTQTPDTFRAKRRPRASLYVRLSKQADDSNLSLDGMVEDVRALCEKEGLEEVALHVDDGKSGGFRDRDEFGLWLDDARQGRCEVLVPYHTDRLTREGLNVAAQILDVVEGKDPHTGRQSHKPVRLLDCFGLDSLHGDAFRFRFVIQAEVGRSERERIRERQRARHKRLRRAGRWAGGTPPFGFRVVPNPELGDDGKPKGFVLEVVPEEAKHIKEAAYAILRPVEPDNLTRVVRRWNHQGIKPRRAAAWSRVTLRQVLTGDIIMGLATEKGKPLRDADGELQFIHPEILPPAYVHALRKALAVKKPDARKGGRRPARLLSGLLTCHACGAVLQVARRSPNAKAPKQAEVTYRCPTKANGGICAQPVSVSAVAIEEHLETRYLATVGDMPYYIERTTVTGLDELAVVDSEIKETLSAMATSADADTFARLQRLQARRQELEDAEPEKRTTLVPTGFTMREHWRDALVDDRRDLLAQAFECMVLGPGQRGPRGFNPARLVAPWAEEPDAGEDYGGETAAE
ncbi:integrase [Streptomyces phage Dubu]|uniref:Serine integrase n=1 Tax=Streptomyces phage Dubu TaxID=2591226 RepID=A0A514DEW6_9CAUD|nr:integrase [Streptomyces phage Dubu]QDH92149.1 serine integrase [Streptomyces phage Dubu]